MSVTSWKVVAVDGLPAPSYDWFFCWAPGWAEPMVLEFSVSDSAPSGLFFNSGGGCSEVTHWMPVTLPAIPTSEGESPQGE